jgi:hypothetical protein
MFVEPALAAACITCGRGRGRVGTRSTLRSAFGGGMNQPEPSAEVSAASALVLVLSAINAGVSRKRLYRALDAMWDELGTKP